ncbi:MAG TPA: sigma-70 family RNA polymerase sigma factor [Beijerinckiaceae bacterium]|nr:sigma-70 family RNA polymerase sigma factor [Beijerinckiaceae bacterium]
MVALSMTSPSIAWLPSPAHETAESRSGGAPAGGAAFPDTPRPEQLFCAPSPAESDQELIRRTSLGDRGAFDLLIARHAEAVLRYLRVLAQSHHDAEDILQETLLAAYRFAGQYRGDASFRTWLYRIAANAYRQERRKSRRAPSPVSLGIDPPQSPEQMAIDRQRRAILDRVLGGLPATDRDVIMLRDISDLSTEQTAHALGIGVPAVKTRLHRARVRLASELTRRRAIARCAGAA